MSSETIEIDRLEAAFDCLAEAALVGAVQLERIWPEQIGDMFARALLFQAASNAVETLRAMWSASIARLYAPSCVMARVILEAGIRSRWASLAEDGWKRMFRFRALEDLKWAKEALGDPDPGVKSAAQHKIINCEAFLTKYPCENPPEGLPKILKEVIELDGSSLDHGRREVALLSIYGHFYRPLSGQVHGMQGGQVDVGCVQHVGVGMILGVKIFLFAVREVISSAPKEQFDAAFQRLDACLHRIGALAPRTSSSSTE